MVVTSRSLESPIFNYRYRGSWILPWKLGTWQQSLYSGSMASTSHAPINTEIDDGGPWLASYIETQITPGTLINDKWEGPFTVAGPRYGWGGGDPAAPSKTDLQMAAMGSTAIARSSPNDPNFSAAQAIGELREGLPKMFGYPSLKERTRIARAAGSEYLNVEFGWKPLVRDLQTLAKTVRESHAIWNAYKRGSGNKTRVGYQFPIVNTTPESYTGEMIPFPSTFTSGFLRGSATQYTEDHAWFKGCFKYYIPEPVGLGGKWDHWLSEAGKLYGVRLTPDVVWNLNPWTWAADWFANTGDLMKNVSNLGTDGLVLQYGYAMHETNAKQSYYGIHPSSGASTSRKVTQKRMKRVAASPYGFNATLSTLTARQLAIIAALGLGRT